jgi:hypothetical protein
MAGETITLSFTFITASTKNIERGAMVLSYPLPVAKKDSLGEFR